MASWGKIGLGLLTGGLSAGAQAVSASEAANAAGEASAAALQMQDLKNEQAMNFIKEQIAASQGATDPWRRQGLDALYNLMYQISGKTPSASDIKEMYLGQAKGEINQIQSKINEIKAREKKGTPVTRSRPGGGFFNRKVHTWIEYQGARPLTEEEIAQIEQLEQRKVQVEQEAVAAAETAAQDWKPMDLQESPLYRQTVDDTTEALNRQLLARGLYGGGSGAKIQADIQSRLAEREAANQFARLWGVSGAGHQAAAGLGAAGMQGAGMGSGTMTGGNANAMNAIIGAGDMAGQAVQIGGKAQADMWSNLGNAILNINRRPNTPVSTPAGSYGGNYGVGTYTLPTSNVANMWTGSLGRY